MTIAKLTQIYFIRVTDNISKVQKLCSLVSSHFTKKDKVLITVPSNEAAVYLDQLLWKIPEESFVPHSIAHSTTKEQVVITTTLSNINQASILINLSGNLHPNPGSAALIYELLDMTSREKEAVSRQKQEAYRQAGHHVEEIL